MNTEKFIADVKARPAIWKFNHPQHKFKVVVKRLWEEIKVKYPDFVIGDLKKKWKNLRDTFSKEIKKIPNPPMGYEPTWKYFKQLEFLKDEYVTSTAESGNEDNDDMSNEANEGKSSPSSTRTSSPFEPSTSSNKNSKKKRPYVVDIRSQYLEIEKKKLKLLEKDMSKNTNVVEEKSDDYHFLMSILPEMEKLPVVQKIRLRNKINDALLEEINISMNDEPYELPDYSSEPNHNNFKIEMK